MTEENYNNGHMSTVQVAVFQDNLYSLIILYSV